jgi:hypothetical protein
VPVERWGEAVGILAQANPARGQQVAQLLSNVQQIQQAQAVQCNSKPEERRRHVEAWSRQQDAEVEIAIGKLTPVQVRNLLMTRSRFSNRTEYREGTCNVRSIAILISGQSHSSWWPGRGTSTEK